jgi:virginiamycin B lyase
MVALCLSTPATAPGFLGPAGNEACPNAAARTAQGSEALPDCRAYERATPSDKGGVDATGTASIVKAARDGDGIAYLSNVGLTALREYTPTLASRGTNGWSSASLLPPAPAAQLSELVGMTPDLAMALDTQDEPGKAGGANLVARLAPSGELRAIAPFTANLSPSFVGASEDGSVVVFESPAALSGSGPALVGGPNLYAWYRSSEEVRLIGLLNDGEEPPEGAIGGPYDWLRGASGIGLAQGGSTLDYYTQDEHVVSADGTAVYFTAAGTGEIYLRRNPASAQSPLSGGDCTDPALACTFEVSASQRASAEARDDPAAFMGASADGDTAFFTSAGELTGDANTGPEPVPPHVSRAGTDGDPASVEQDFLPARATGVAVDGSHLYWANPSRGSIGRANLDGTGVEEDFVDGLVQPRWVAVDGGYLYWTSLTGRGSIGRAELDGSAAEPEFIAGAGRPQGIAVDGTRVYWANDAPNGIGRANLDGTGVEPAFHPLGSAEAPRGVAVDSSHIYWTENEPAGYVGRADLDGTHETFHLVGGAKELRGIALDGEHVYWAASSGGEIGRANLELGEFETAFVTAAERPAGLAVDASHLYWATGGSVNPGNDLYRYQADGRELTDLTPDAGDSNGAEVQGVLGISEDGAYVYFVANGVLSSESNANGETVQPGTCQGRPGSASGSCNLYVSHAGTVYFIARLQADGSASVSDAVDWAPTPTGVSDLPTVQPTARVSADGRTLLFRSRRQLSPYPNRGAPELYRYRVGEPGLICVSCDPDGTPSGVTLATVSPPTAYSPLSAGVLARNLSADGDRIFFESLDPLVETDHNGEEGCPPVGSPTQAFPACQDVYEWEAPGAGSCSAAAATGCVYLLSAAESGRPAFFADASRSGNDAFIFTAAPLVGQDLDELIDVYDARVDGGIAAQDEPAARCVGEGCRPPPTPLPALPLPATDLSGGRTHRRPHRCRRVRRSSGRHHSGGRRRCARARRPYR